MGDQRQVLVGVEIGSVTGAQIVAGIRRYLVEQQLSWRLAVGAIDTVDRLDRLDGIIGFIRDTTTIALARDHDVPVVSCSVRLPQLPLARVLPDDRAVGRLAARHLLDQGFRRFLVSGGGERAIGFRTGVAQADCPCIDTDDWTNRDRERQATRLKALVAGEPLAAFCTTDQDAVWFYSACDQAGLTIPGDLAVLGADNHATTCCTLLPNLSSIRVPWDRIGHRLALELHRRLHGTFASALDRTVVRVGPMGVVERESIAGPGIDDPLILEALALLDQRPSAVSSVGELAARLACTPRHLQQRCRDVLQRSPGDLLAERRIAWGMELLSCTDLGIEAIARRVGYRSRQGFWAVFARVTGESPAEYRQRIRTQAQSA